MKSILLIGLGRFGRHIARKLDELHHQVMAVDIDEKRVEAALPYVTNAQIGDGTDEDFVRSLGVRNFDAVSYTHLDVYKRQPSGGGILSGKRDRQDGSGGLQRDVLPDGYDAGRKIDGGAGAAAGLYVG